ncbi:MAG: response regulator [Anaerolineae bacterium]
MAFVATVLIVDDNPVNLQLLENVLTTEGYNVNSVRSGAMALRSVASSPPDLILLDVMMPEMNGYEVCRQLKADDATTHIPVLFVSALDETVDKVKGFQFGGQDYITKPFQVEEVLARVNTHLTLALQRREIERLRQQERQHFETLIELRDDVVATVSHDIKNPIGIIRNALELLKYHGRMDDEKGQRYIGMIRRGADRILDLITDLLDLARIETGLDLAIESQSIHPLLQAINDEYQQSTEESGIELKLVLPDNDIVVPFDYARMQQVLHNYMSNAVKFSPDGGTVSLSAWAEDDELIIAVADGGLGIPEADLPHLFDKFHRVDTREHLAIEGTGLGLSIVKAIVDQHGGRVWAESTQGSTFYAALPLES